jgi:hypothetical protein
MKTKLLSILFLIVVTDYLYAQKIDTISYDGVISSINYTMGDTVRKVNYVNGKIYTIKNYASFYGCITPILTDTIYPDDTNYFMTNEHEIIQLGGSKSCDSLLRITTNRTYENDKLKGVAQYKYVGPFGGCPCGQWTFYKDEVRTIELTNCMSSKLDNITLTSTHWKSDSTYSIEVYKENLQMAMPGQGGDHSATIVLKNKSGEIINVVSSSSKESVMHRDVSIAWDSKKNRVYYARGKSIEWINENNIDMNIIREVINRLIKDEKWDYFKIPEIFGDKSFIIGEFYGEPEYDRTLDIAVLIKDSIGKVKLLIIDNYQYIGQENVEIVEFEDKGEFDYVGHFKAVRIGEPLWSNWVEGKGDYGLREFKDVPRNEILYLNYDGIYTKAGDSCGGGFIYWKDNKWNWLQQE